MKAGSGYSWQYSASPKKYGRRILTKYGSKDVQLRHIILTKFEVLVFYAVIIAVADKIPNNVLEEDPKLLMWHDQAVTRREMNS